MSNKSAINTTTKAISLKALHEQGITRTAAGDRIIHTADAGCDWFDLVVAGAPGVICDGETCTVLSTAPDGSVTLQNGESGIKFRLSSSEAKIAIFG